ncbi:hypothetical protein LNV09_01975 [Paucibacter sp. B2R-40]|uniref:hypothetical protein n=1 Tax=Paucibacter sp. B2R-40 TaxID=2893554 RepID=UPI0021E3B495|nr:hypothetical protein [Paucibacter sp. B2R-40]MCV2352924.1 hypothetical protein [Paucibacter sp. B2R-40]
MMSAGKQLPPQAPKAAMRAQWILCGLTLLALLGLSLLQTVLAPVGAGASPIDIELLATAQQFQTHLLADWQAVDAGQCGLSGWGGWGEPVVGPNFGRLSCHLLVDSALLVPGYVGMLVFFTLSLARRLKLRGALPHLLCLPAVAAGLADLAENGMTLRALEQLQYFVLADAAVADVRMASLLKWGLLSVAAFQLAWMAFELAWFSQEPADRPARLIPATVFMGGASLVWAWALHFEWYLGLQLGMLLAAGGLVALLWWQLLQLWPLSHTAAEPLPVDVAAGRD